MPQSRKEELRKRVRHFTKRIGQALKVNDHNEVSNLREQRGVFVTALIEEFDEYFFLKNNKSCFGSLDEAKEHYEDPDNRKSVAAAKAISEMYQGREFLRKRCKAFDSMSGEELKIQVIDEIKEQMIRMENMINQLLDEVGKAPIDFVQADEDKQDDFLDGIDLDSLI